VIEIKINYWWAGKPVYLYVNQKLNVMNKNELTTEQLVLIVFIMMLLINGMMSCTSSRVVYQQDQEGIVWKTGPKVSTVTGYKYK
jgi:hypothetical protein